MPQPRQSLLLQESHAVLSFFFYICLCSFQRKHQKSTPTLRYCSIFVISARTFLVIDIEKTSGSTYKWHIIINHTHLVNALPTMVNFFFRNLLIGNLIMPKEVNPLNMTAWTLFMSALPGQRPPFKVKIHRDDEISQQESSQEQL